MRNVLVVGAVLGCLATSGLAIAGASDHAKGLSPTLVQKLSVTQIYQLLEQREITRRKSIPSDPAGYYATVSVFILFFTFLGATQWSRYRRDRLRHETLRAMIEKGSEIPPGLLETAKPHTSDLRRGLILLGAGVGLAAFIALSPIKAPGVWSLGLIPILIGAGYLVAHKLEPQKAQA